MKKIPTTIQFFNCVYTPPNGGSIHRSQVEQAANPYDTQFIYGELYPIGELPATIENIRTFDYCCPQAGTYSQNLKILRVMVEISVNDNGGGKFVISSKYSNRILSSKHPSKYQMGFNASTMISLVKEVLKLSVGTPFWIKITPI